MMCKFPNVNNSFNKDILRRWKYSFLIQKKRYLNQKYLSYKLITNIFNYLESPIAPWSVGAVSLDPSEVLEPSVTTRIGNLVVGLEYSGASNPFL